MAAIDTLEEEVTDLLTRHGSSDKITGNENRAAALKIIQFLRDLQTGEGSAGADGTNGWTPTWAIVPDGARRVIKITDWTGGTGTKPAVNKYIGSTGLVSLITAGEDIRGAAGADGAPGGTTDFATVVTASRPLTGADISKNIPVNNSANTDLTIPIGLGSGFAKILAQRLGTGTVTWVAADGVTLRDTAGLNGICPRYLCTGITRIGPDEWAVQF